MACGMLQGLVNRRPQRAACRQLPMWQGAAASQPPPCGGRGGACTGAGKKQTVGRPGVTRLEAAWMCPGMAQQAYTQHQCSALTLACQQVALGGGRRCFSSAAALNAADTRRRRGSWSGSRASSWRSSLPCCRHCGGRSQLHLSLQRLRRLQGGTCPCILRCTHIVEPGVGQRLAGGDALARVIAQQASQEIKAGGIQLRHRLRAGWQVRRGVGAGPWAGTLADVQAQRRWSVSAADAWPGCRVAVNQAWHRMQPPCTCAAHLRQALRPESGEQRAPVGQAGDARPPGLVRRAQQPKDGQQLANLWMVGRVGGAVGSPPSDQGWQAAGWCSAAGMAGWAPACPTAGLQSCTTAPAQALAMQVAGSPQPSMTAPTSLSPRNSGAPLASSASTQPQLQRSTGSE